MVPYRVSVSFIVLRNSRWRKFLVLHQHSVHLKD